MNFYIPTKIYSEDNCVINHSKDLASFGKKALLVTGASSSKRNGSLDAVTKALSMESIPYCIYNKIEENPSVETVIKAARFGIKEEVDFVIGVGGGSPLDAAKAIALLIKNPGSPSSVLYEKIALESLPVVAVPTTAGTGSEATPYAILTLHNEKTKRSISHRIFPTLALVDYTYLRTVPKSVLVNTAVDSLGHLIESYINVNATDYSKMLCEYGFHLWSSIKPVLKDLAPVDHDYETLMTASTIAGMAIAHTGTSLPHGMSYSFTYEKEIPHGKAVGIFLGAYLDANPNRDIKERMLHLLGFHSPSSFSSFLHELLGDVVITKAELCTYVEDMIKNKAKLANCPYSVTTESLKHLYMESVITNS